MSRRFRWSELNLWTREIPHNTTVILGGSDNMIPAPEIHALLTSPAILARGVQVVHKAEMGHGGFLLDPSVQDAILRADSLLPSKEVMVTSLPSKVVPAVAAATAAAATAVSMVSAVALGIDSVLSGVAFGADEEEEGDAELSALLEQIRVKSASLKAAAPAAAAAGARPGAFLYPLAPSYALSPLMAAAVAAAGVAPVSDLLHSVRRSHVPCRAFGFMPRVIPVLSRGASSQAARLSEVATGRIGGCRGL